MPSMFTREAVQAGCAMHCTLLALCGPHASPIDNLLAPTANREKTARMLKNPLPRRTRHPLISYLKRKHDKSTMEFMSYQFKIRQIESRSLRSGLILYVREFSIMGPGQIK